jgi:hypothetical protein
MPRSLKLERLNHAVIENGEYIAINKNEKVSIKNTEPTR